MGEVSACAKAGMCKFSDCCPPIKLHQRNKKRKTHKKKKKGGRGKIISRQAWPVSALSVFEPGRTAPLLWCVSTYPAVWAHIYMSFSTCVVFTVDSVQSGLASVRVHTFSFFFFHFIGFWALEDEAADGWCVFLSLPTGLELPAGFPQTINHGSLLLALVITAPIRTKGEEEYQWRRKMRTSHHNGTESHMYCFYAQTMLYSEPRVNGKDETTYQ